MLPMRIVGLIRERRVQCLAATKYICTGLHKTRNESANGLVSHRKCKLKVRTLFVREDESFPNAEQSKRIRTVLAWHAALLHGRPVFCN